MSEESFLHDHGDRLAAAAAARGPCPTDERLTAFAAAGAGHGGADAELADHLAVCGTCSLLVERLRAAPPELDELGARRAWRRLEGRAAPWRRRRLAPRLAAAAAVVLAAVGVVWITLRQAPPPPIPDPGVTRGAAVTLAEPLGEAASIERFAWSGLPLGALYRLEVRADHAVTWRGETTATELAPPAELRQALAALPAFEWRVVALDEAGTELATSGWAEVRPRPPG
ncbi:MAG TPA: hypothetical protein VMT16_08575 [Thermoanaerobaculia bacterium]|nr:hypothetical protein [Thermoanaerobaculia bacterium]